jgi:hypothetical protein
MCNIKDNIPMSNPNNIITSSYTSINYSNLGSDNVFYLPSIFNESDLDTQYIEDKENMEKYLYNIELINMNLLKNIIFLNKICYNVNIKHSNTINFVMKNYIHIKKTLDNYLILYNENIIKINITNKKINDINIKMKYFQDLELSNIHFLR